MKIGVSNFPTDYSMAAVPLPKPVRKPHPPIYIGASSRWAIERVVEYADDWLPVAVPGFEQRLAELDALCAAHGRDRSEIDVSVMATVESPEHLARLAEMGVRRVILRCRRCRRARRSRCATAICRCCNGPASSADGARGNTA